MTKYNRFSYTYRQTPRACPKCGGRRTAITYGGRAYWHCVRDALGRSCMQDDELMRVLVRREPKA